jgi:hypothetical protein
MRSIEKITPTLLHELQRLKSDGVLGWRSKTTEMPGSSTARHQIGAGMPNVMPSQVVQTIDELFSHAATGRGGQLQASHSPQLIGIMNLVKAIPPELITVPSNVYADLVLAMSTIEYHLEVWTSRGPEGTLDNVKGTDAVTLIRKVLAQCPDEFPAPAATDLLFVKDDELRDSLRRDVGAAIRALNNSEWKAATVLAGATIEALLHWKLQQPPITQAARDAAVKALVAAKKMQNPSPDIDYWTLQHFVEIAADLELIGADTTTEVRLAQNFRNLIHPGRAARLGQTCDRGTAYSAIGALDHVIRDIGR